MFFWTVTPSLKMILVAVLAAVVSAAQFRKRKYAWFKIIPRVKIDSTVSVPEIMSQWNF
jgi:hypothetical protein